MHNKLCKECAFWRDEYCSMRREIIPSDVRVLNCEMFELKVIPTLFDRITVSPEILARSLCGNVRVGCFSGYYSMLTGNYYPDMEKAVASTLEKLKEVENR